MPCHLDIYRGNNPHNSLCSTALREYGVIVIFSLICFTPLNHIRECAVYAPQGDNLNILERGKALGYMSIYIFFSKLGWLLWWGQNLWDVIQIKVGKHWYKGYGKSVHIILLDPVGTPVVQKMMCSVPHVAALSFPAPGGVRYPLLQKGLALRPEPNNWSTLWWTGTLTTPPLKRPRSDQSRVGPIQEWGSWLQLSGLLVVLRDLVQAKDIRSTCR